MENLIIATKKWVKIGNQYFTVETASEIIKECNEIFESIK